jgi:hypothetical protein
VISTALLPAMSFPQCSISILMTEDQKSASSIVLVGCSSSVTLPHRNYDALPLEGPAVVASTSAIPQRVYAQPQRRTPIAKRLVGSRRRECLDFMIPLGEKHQRTTFLTIRPYVRAMERERRNDSIFLLVRGLPGTIVSGDTVGDSLSCQRPSCSASGE